MRISEEDRRQLDECQRSIGYTFRNPALLLEALTHTSGANTRGSSNERLEFLGDSVIGLVTCDLLFRRFPDFQEGAMTTIKSTVVSRETCARFSSLLNLSQYMILGRGLGKRAPLPSNILADVFESLIGAIYLDGGYPAAVSFSMRLLEPEIIAVANDALMNTKSALQQTAQRMHGKTPIYTVADEQGPDHARSFKIVVVIGRTRYPAAWGRTKKEGELRAASNAMAVLERRPIPFNADPPEPETEAEAGAQSGPEAGGA